MVDKNIDIFVKYNPFDDISTKIYYHTQSDAADIMRYNMIMGKQIFSCERAVLMAMRLMLCITYIIYI